MLDREMTPKDSAWKALDLYVRGKTGLIRGIRVYNYFDRNGKKMDNSVSPDKISIKEVEHITIHRLDEFDFDGSTKSTFTIDVYAKQSKFTPQHYPTTVLMRNSSGGYYFGTVGIVNYSAITPVVSGYYQARTFYKPKFGDITEAKKHFGTYYWNPNVRIENNGEASVDYNPEKQPFGKIRIEGITNDGIPFAKEIKMY
jgi:hypothetical protein